MSDRGVDLRNKPKPSTLGCLRTRQSNSLERSFLEVYESQVGSPVVILGFLCFQVLPKWSVLRGVSCTRIFIIETRKPMKSLYIDLWVVSEDREIKLSMCPLFNVIVKMPKRSLLFGYGFDIDIDPLFVVDNYFKEYKGL
ncbi:hypothetical protein RND71_002050 [Anisodus tanguticus]|uniref:Uncharacterized protein n=1 Tax=Anisodus tanguticus TaxID=243964 RepID=A0AAE1SZ40_9SOLA|nr:hypothetical protein RND71_002050 [Anisodus tanguticus]